MIVQSESIAMGLFEDFMTIQKFLYAGLEMVHMDTFFFQL